MNPAVGAMALVCSLMMGIPSASPAGEEAGSPRFTSEFRYLLDDLRPMSAEDRGRAEKSVHTERATPLFRLRGKQSDQIQAYVWLDSWDQDLRDAVVAAGAQLEEEDPSRLLMQVWLPIDRAEAIASIKGVRHIRRPSYASPASGAVLTEGDTNIGSFFIRALGNKNGLGIRVGVISHGLFDAGFSSGSIQSGGANRDGRVLSGDLPIFPVPDPSVMAPTFGFLGGVEIFPSSPTIHDLTQEGVPAFGRTFAEGAAILEILHDVAPGSKLFYADAKTDVELQSRRNTMLRIIGSDKIPSIDAERDEGVDVIVDDLVFYDSGRFDGSSPISRRAQEIVLNNDVVYVSATGDYTPPPTGSGTLTAAQSGRFPIFVNGYFTPVPGANDSKVHNWTEGRAPQITDNVLLVRPQSGVIDIAVVWDDIWDDVNPRAKDDIDLFLLKPLDLTPSQASLPPLPEVVRGSTDLQNGTTGRPIERFTYIDSSNVYGNNNFRLVMSRKNSLNSTRTLFTLIIFQGIVDSSDSVYLTHGIAGNNGDALPPVITVGSLDAQLGVDSVLTSTVPGLSPGPGRAFDNNFVRWFTRQTTPSVVSYSNVTTRSSGSYFPGSSAAAAHIGGLVSLLRHSFRDIPAYEYYNILRATGNDAQFPNATALNTETLEPFGNAPTYLRVNGFDTWFNLGGNTPVAPERRSAKVSPMLSVTAWEPSDSTGVFADPDFGSSSLGVSLSPAGRNNVFGFWQTPVLAFSGPGGTESAALSTNKLYRLTARIGTDESDPSRVPDFRLRLTSGANDESGLLVVAGLDSSAANTPNTIGGKEYELYYRPTNSAVAAQGVRFAFDLIHFDPSDNADATLFVQDVKFEEFNIPE